LGAFAQDLAALQEIGLISFDPKAYNLLSRNCSQVASRIINSGLRELNQNSLRRPHSSSGSLVPNNLLRILQQEMDTGKHSLFNSVFIEVPVEAGQLNPTTLNSLNMTTSP
jgi:hypothetical protein